MNHRSGSFLAGFEEFKNTKASRKAQIIEGKDGIALTARLTKSYKDKMTVNITLSKGLVDSLKKEHLTTFKFLYNEAENAIAIKYDNSSNAYNLDDYTIAKSGIIQIRDQFITYTLSALMEKEKTVGYKYTGKYFQGELCYILRVNKKFKKE